LTTPSKSAIRVSYIMTTFNRAAFFEKALVNVREFITACDELLVMDGGSSDNTSLIAQCNQDIITHFVSEKDKGEAHALNKGILLAQGEFIKFLTDDDFTYATCMKEAVNAMVLDNSIDALFCGGERFVLTPNGSLEFTTFCRLTGNEVQKIGKPVSETGDFPGSGIGLIIRRRIIPLVGLFNTTYLCVDSEFLARLKEADVNLRYFDGKLYRHIGYPHSGMTNYKRGKIDAVRIYIQMRYMSSIFLYSNKTIIHALGLNKILGGELLGNMLINAEKLRYHPTGRAFLKINNKLLSSLAKIRKYKNKVSRQHKNCNLCVDTIKTIKTEPNWSNQVH